MKTLSLNDAQTRRLIPDYLLLNNDLLIPDASDSVKCLFNINILSSLTDIFTLIEPPSKTISFSYLRSFATQTLSFVSLNEPGLKYGLKIEYLEKSEQLLLVFADLFPAGHQEPAEESDRFIYAVTHELKNPLAAIQSSAELIQLKQQRTARELSSNTKAHFEAIFSEVDKLALMLKNIAFISAKATICLKKTNTEMEAFVQNVLQYSFLTYFDEGKFNVAVKGKQRNVMIDQQLLSQVIVNLVYTVMQYSKREDPICIAIWFLKNELKLIVEDQQALIPETVHNRYKEILNANRPEGINDTKEWGFLVVKKIIAAHSGTVDFSGKKLFKAGFVVNIDC